MRNFYNHYLKILGLLFLSVITNFVFAQQADSTATAGSGSASGWNLDINIILTILAVSLFVVILILSFLIRSSIALYKIVLDKEKKARNSGKIATMIIGLLLMSSATVFAQDAGAASTSDAIGTETILKYSLLLIIALEIVAIIALLRWHRFFTGIEGMAEAKLERPKSASSFTEWWNSINKFKSIESEEAIDMGHSYDGIRELDNVLPPWFTWTFIASIVFGFGYLWRYHWAPNPAPNQYQAYEKEVAAAKIKQDAYLKSRGDQVNETNVKMVDAAGVEAGKKLFSSNCAVCHGDKGQGGVGPNLTDDYWLHGGTINDIFKTIKYGVVEKGMQSWKDVFSPDQIADLSSYIITLHGSNPPGAKEPQGELFKGDATGGGTGSADSAAAKTGDSTAAKK